MKAKLKQLGHISWSDRKDVKRKCYVCRL